MFKTVLHIFTKYSPINTNILIIVFHGPVTVCGKFGANWRIDGIEDRYSVYNQISLVYYKHIGYSKFLINGFWNSLELSICIYFNSSLQIHHLKRHGFPVI